MTNALTAGNPNTQQGICSVAQKEGPDWHPKRFGGTQWKPSSFWASRLAKPKTIEANNNNNNSEQPVVIPSTYEPATRFHFFSPRIITEGCHNSGNEVGAFKEVVVVVVVVGGGGIYIYI